MSDKIIHVPQNAEGNCSTSNIISEGGLSFTFDTSEFVPLYFRDTICGRNFNTSFKITILIRCKIAGAIFASSKSAIVLVDPYTFANLGIKELQGATLIQMSQKEADSVEKNYFE